MFKPKNTPTLSAELQAEQLEVLKTLGQSGYEERCAEFNKKLAAAGVPAAFFLSGN
jgi:hypothetical protein